MRKLGGANGSFFGPKLLFAATACALPINQNQVLFSLLGTTFGGDGRVIFGPPSPG